MVLNERERTNPQNDLTVIIDMHNNLSTIDNFWEFIGIHDLMIVEGWK